MRLRQSAHPWRRLVEAAIVGLVLAACGAPHAPGDVIGDVVISAAVPDVALPGATVTLVGAGFTAALALSLDGVTVPVNVEAADRLTFTVPDTPGYPRIQLGGAGADRLLFVGAQYVGELAAADVQAAIDGLPPDVALRLPPGSITGDHLVVDERWLFGSGSGDGGTRLDLSGTAWYLAGSGVAEIVVAARQHVVVADPPDDPGVPFGTLAGGAEGGAPAHAAAALDADPQRPTRARDARLESGSGVELAAMPGLHVDATIDTYELEHAVVVGDEAFITVNARNVAWRGVQVNVGNAFLSAWQALELADVEVATLGRMEFYVDDVERMTLVDVALDAGTDILVRSGGTSDVEVGVSRVRATGRDVTIDPTNPLRVSGLTIEATRDVWLESGSFDLAVADAEIAFGGGVILLADNGSMRIDGVGMAFDVGGADDSALETGMVFMRAEDDVAVDHVAWDTPATAIVARTGSIALRDADLAGDEEVMVEAEGGTLEVVDARIVGDVVVLDGRAIHVERSQLVTTSLLEIEANEAVTLVECDLKGGAIDLFVGAGGFVVQGVTMASNTGAVLASEGGSGLIEDTTIGVRARDGFTASSDVALTLRRVHFTFGIGLVFAAPPGALILEDVTGADDAETPGQP